MKFESSLTALEGFADQTWSDQSSYNYGLIFLKKDFSDNLNCLVKFVQENVIDSFEKLFYLENIQNAFELLAKFY